jgi:hypothetical protein
LLIRRQDDLAALIKLGKRSIDAALFRAGDRMAGHEISRDLSRRCLHRIDYALFGAAGIGDDGGRFQLRNDAPENSLHGADRHGHHHDIGIRRSLGRIAFIFIDDAELDGAAQLPFVAPAADDGAHLAGLAQCARQRAADQADADDA